MVLPGDEVLRVGGHLTDAVLLQLGFHLPHLHTTYRVKHKHVVTEPKGLSGNDERRLPFLGHESYPGFGA